MNTIRIVPNYELPPSLDQIEILRVVVRENVTEVVCIISLTLFYGPEHLPFHNL